MINTGAEARTSYSSIVGQLVRDRVASRLFAKDATLWGAEAQVEAAQRLNWVDPFAASERSLGEAIELRTIFDQQSISRIVLCGMGGSSLGPEVLAQWAGVELTLLDSTHPDAVKQLTQSQLTHTAVIVSSKSGSTVETLSHLACFEAAFAAAGISASERIVVVTDPGSALERYAISQSYRVFQADPDVGGRFSVLTAFGVVPGILSGVDMQQVLDDARSAQSALAVDYESNPAIQLAAEIACGLPQRYVLAAAESTGAHWGLGDWIEQLVAESTGKSGVGVLPIALTTSAPDFLADISAVRRVYLEHGDVLSVHSSDAQITVCGPLGAQFLLWETATALLGRVMCIDPFNQPDVESAKIAARATLRGSINEADASVPSVAHEHLFAELRRVLTPSSYVAIQAYLDASGSRTPQLQRIREQLAEELHRPVALGWGPRYLHSTGQLHKGGPATGVFVQVVDDAAAELEIPGSDQGFAALIRSQSRGDRAVLQQKNRPVFVLRASELDEFERSLNASHR